jgi:hypothetical protein
MKREVSRAEGLGRGVLVHHLPETFGPTDLPDYVLMFPLQLSIILSPRCSPVTLESEAERNIRE